MRRDNTFGMHREHQEERQEDEDGRADERHPIRPQDVDQDAGDDGADGLRQRPHRRPEADDLRRTSGRDEVHEQRYGEGGPEPVGDPDEGHDRQRLGHRLDLRTDEGDETEHQITVAKLKEQLSKANEDNVAANAKINNLEMELFDKENQLKVVSHRFGKVT